MYALTAGRTLARAAADRRPLHLLRPACRYHAARARALWLPRHAACCGLRPHHRNESARRCPRRYREAASLGTASGRSSARDRRITADPAHLANSTPSARRLSAVVIHKWPYVYKSRRALSTAETRGAISGPAINRCRRSGQTVARLCENPWSYFRRLRAGNTAFPVDDCASEWHGGRVELRP